MAAATPKPRLVKLAIASPGEDAFSVRWLQPQGHSLRHKGRDRGRGGCGGAYGRKAIYSETHVWILSGDAPAFVKLEGALADEGPIWRIELTSPVLL